MEIVLRETTYNEIVSIINKQRGFSWQLHQELSEKYGIPLKTAASIIYNNFTRKMRHSYGRHKRMSYDIHKRYKRAVSSGEPIGIIMRLADELQSSPHLIAKLILEVECAPKKKVKKDSFEEEVSEDSNDIKSNDQDLLAMCRSNISAMLKDSTLISDGRLAVEIMLCSINDTQYGPITDLYNRLIGEEFEKRLETDAIAAGISFQTETDLRAHGYDKTPDLRLDVPVAVDGRIVNWIESKGLFGEEAVHNEYISNQYSSYWNRFGPGLVIYWLGYVDSIVDPDEKRFLIRSEFPQQLTHMKPMSIAHSYLEQDEIPDTTNFSLSL